MGMRGGIGWVGSSLLSFYPPNPHLDESPLLVHHYSGGNVTNYLIVT